MLQIEEIQVLPLTTGNVMRLFIDHSQPENSLDYQWTETSYDGKPESWLFEIPPHWHKYHDELMTVTEGRIEFTIEGKTQMLEADPNHTVKIPRWQWHTVKAIKGVPMTLKERTDPGGRFKRDFFRDLLAVPFPGGFLRTMRVFYDGDTYPSLPGHIKIVDQIFINVVGGLAKLVLPAENLELDKKK